MKIWERDDKKKKNRIFDTSDTRAQKKRQRGL